MADAERGGDLGCGTVPPVAGPQATLILIVAQPAFHQLGDRRQSCGCGPAFGAGPRLDGGHHGRIVGAGQRCG